MLAKTVFEVGPDVLLEAQDVYNSDEAKLTSPSVPGIKKQVGNSIKDSFSPKGGVGKALADLNKLAQTKGKPFINAVKDIKGILKNKDQYIDSVSNKMLSPMLKSIGYTGKPSELIDGVLGVDGANPIGHILNNTSGDLRLILEGVDKVRRGDIDSIGDMLAMVGEITGNKDLIELVNIGTELAVLVEVLDKTFNTRVSEITDTVVNTVTSEEDRIKLLIHASINAAIKSDLVYLNKIISEVGVGRILALYPNIVNIVLRNYRYSPGVYSPTEADYTLLTSTLFKLDSKWDKVDFKGTEILDLEPYTHANSTARELLSTNDNTKIGVMVGKHYHETTMIASAKTMFPLAVW